MYPFKKSEQIFYLVHLSYRWEREIKSCVLFHKSKPPDGGEYLRACKLCYVSVAKKVTKKQTNRGMHVFSVFVCECRKVGILCDYKWSLP
jgi:hypothetical protein